MGEMPAERGTGEVAVGGHKGPSHGTDTVGRGRGGRLATWLCNRLASFAMAEGAPWERDQMASGAVLPAMCPFDPPMLDHPLAPSGRRYRRTRKTSRALPNQMVRGGGDTKCPRYTF